MRKLALFVTTLLIASVSFASSSSFKNAISNSWKANQTSNLQPGHDINIVYGGEDVYKQSIIATTIIA